LTEGLACIAAQKRTHFCDNKTSPPRKLRVNAVLLAYILLRLKFNHAFFFRIGLWRWAVWFTLRLNWRKCYLFSSGFQSGETFNLGLVFGFESFDKVPRVLDE
jgi:hypothetical protein